MSDDQSQQQLYEAVTEGVRVTVRPEYLPDQSDEAKNRHVWAYHICVRNEGDETVQLQSRCWHITDDTGFTEIVKGPGVVGEQPILTPGDEFHYSSGCPLKTESGFMVGTYTMQRQSGGTFAAAVPAFALDRPNGRHSIN